MSKIYCVATNAEGVRRGISAKMQFFTNYDKAMEMVEEYTVTEDRVQISHFVGESAIVREIYPMEWLEMGFEVDEGAIVEIISYEISLVSLTDFTAID